MAPLLQECTASLAQTRFSYARYRFVWPIRARHRLSLYKIPAACMRARIVPFSRRRIASSRSSLRRRTSQTKAAAPLKAQLQTKSTDTAGLEADAAKWRQNPTDDGWNRQPLSASDSARSEAFGGVLFEADQADDVTGSPKAQPKGPILKDAGAVLSMVDALKREDYAIGVIAVALGVEAVRAAGRVVPTLPRLVQEGSATVKGLGPGLDRSKTQAAGRAHQWLSAMLEDGRRQARVSQGTLREWPDLVRASVQAQSKKYEASAEQLMGNMSEWAEVVRQTTPSVSAVQDLWQSAASAARHHRDQIKQKAQLPAFKMTDVEAALTAPPASLGRQQEQLRSSGGSFLPDASAAAESSPPVRKQVPHLALPAPDMPAAAKSLPPALPAGPAPKHPIRSDTQVYAAEAEVAESQAKESKSSAGKRAEEAWNERIKGAYAAIAAATPYTPATKKPNSHALSWHRGGNTTLLKPDFQVPRTAGHSPSSGSGHGSGSSGGSGAGGGGGDGDGSEEDSEQPEQNPRDWLWAKVLLAASAAAAAAEQALAWPRRRARLLAVLTMLGAIAALGYKSQTKGARRLRKKVSRFPMQRLGFGRSRSGPTDVAVGELIDFSDDESF